MWRPPLFAPSCRPPDGNASSNDAPPLWRCGIAGIFYPMRVKTKKEADNFTLSAAYAAYIW